MGIVAALLKSPEQLHRLRAAIRGRYLVTPCEDWEAVRRLCDAGLLTVLMPGCFAATASLVADEREAFRIGARAFASYCRRGFASSPPFSRSITG